MPKTVQANQPVNVTRTYKHGHSTYVLIPKQIHDLMQWNIGDVIAMRIAGEKLILQRVPLETMAKFGLQPAEALR